MLGPNSLNTVKRHLHPRQSLRDLSPLVIVEQLGAAVTVTSYGLAWPDLVSRSQTTIFAQGRLY